MFKGRRKKQDNIILINAEHYETRVAMLEKGKLIEYITERETEKGIIGNIYKGRVDRILPGIGAAFIDIGIGKNCFLYVSDIYYDVKSYASWLGDEFSDDDNNAAVQKEADEPEPDEEEDDSDTEELKPSGKQHHYPVTIEDLIQKNQEILVQIVKEPLGKKGARATSHITLPGKYLVLMPTIKHIGISRKIADPKERDRLREMAKTLVPEGMGLIVRTAAGGISKEDFRRDCLFLTNLWQRIQKRSESVHAPSMVNHDLELTFRVVRDMLNDSVDSVIIDSREDYEKIVELVNQTSPDLRHRIVLHESSDPLFDLYNVESQIDELLQRKIWLKSGGHIYIDEAEALVAIDVNTGKYVGGHNIEDTLVKTNLEAAKEIAHQIRARGLGGLLVIDFIDMKKRGNQQKVYQAFMEALKNDRERSTVLEMTEVGLIQMTRKRVRPSLLKTLTQPCPYCNGNGVIQASDTMSIRVLRELKKVSRMTSKAKIVVKVHPDLHKILYEEMETELHAIGEKYRKTISIVPDDKLHFEKYNVELVDL